MKLASNPYVTSKQKKILNIFVIYVRDLHKTIKYIYLQTTALQCVCYSFTKGQYKSVDASFEVYASILIVFPVGRPLGVGAEDIERVLTHDAGSQNNGKPVVVHYVLKYSTHNSPGLLVDLHEIAYDSMF